MLVNIRNREKQDISLKAAKEQAEAASVFKTQFLANMSHEIRTPMNSVMGYLQLLELNESNPDQLKTISKMMDSANMLLNVINDILDVSKIEAGKLELEQVDFALRSIIDAAVSPFAYRSERKGVEFAVEIDDVVPQIVTGDPLRLRQILINLCSNAVKFTEQGSIKLLIKLLREDECINELLFIIEDTGIGMSAETIDKLFKPFTQADSTLTRRFRRIRTGPVDLQRAGSTDGWPNVGRK